jgi:hypothetical protein
LCKFFLLLFFLTCRPDEERDLLLSEHVMSLHTSRDPGGRQGASALLNSINCMRFPLFCRFRFFSSFFFRFWIFFSVLVVMVLFSVQW